VPVTVANKVAAMVYLKHGAAQKNHYHLSSYIFSTAILPLPSKHLTEPDVAFSYTGLRTGNYTAQTSTRRI